MKLKILEIAKLVGSEIVRNFVPGGSAIITAANLLLPKGKQLSDNSTGDDIQKTIESLPINDRAKIIDHQFDVDKTFIIESSSCIQAMLEADFKTPHTTRPKIALGCFYIVAFTVISVVGAWVYGVLLNEELMVSTIMQGWPFILAMIGTPTTLLLAYFGVLKKEHGQRLQAAQGTLKSSNFVSKLVSLFGK